MGHRISIFAAASVVLVIGAHVISFANAEDEVDLMYQENNIYVPHSEYKVLDHSERYLGESVVDLPLEPDFSSTIEGGKGGGSGGEPNYECVTEQGEEKECKKHPEHKRDNCTFKGTGPACKTEERTCAMPDGGTTSFEVNFCCDFGPNKDKPCGCNQEIAAPGKCAGNPEMCLFCLAVDEVGHHSGQTACTACVKSQADNAIANGNAKDYCELTTSFGRGWKYEGVGSCLCNKDMKVGENAKFCKCCNGASGLTPEQEKEVRDGLKKECSAKGIDQYRASGQPPPLKWTDHNGNGNVDKGETKPCPKVSVPGCTAVEFYDCE